jgi:uncharacterized protein (TIGR00251 family)
LASGADLLVIRIQQSGDGVTFSVKVHPRARRERISAVLGDVLKLEITAPPLEGKANDACIDFFSDFLKVPRSSVTIAAGLKSRNKVIRISGISPAAVEQAFATVLKTL